MPKRSAPPAEKNDSDPIEHFEQNMSELEAIVDRMEAGELKLEESLKLFERGTQLAQECRKSLDNAEAKLKSLTETDAAEIDDGSQTS